MERSARHYGLDWLRIGAFGLLIVYHVAMVFAPWDWVVKWPTTYPALVAPMAALTPWRLPLLFVVSGYATRHLLARSPGAQAFLRARSARLLIPVGFALVALLPAELWVRVRMHGYEGGLLRYWLTDYWSPWPVEGYTFPSWEHLWFVVYLWAYTALLAGLVARFGTAPLQRSFDRLARGWRLLWLPVGALVAAKLLLMFAVPERQGLTTDWAGHAEYLPLFLFGFALAGSPALAEAVTRCRRGALGLALVGGAIEIWGELAYQGRHVPGHAVMALDRAGRLVMAWGVILLLLHVATRWWNRDHPVRATLAEAVFPAYLVHHPVLVVFAWWLAPSGMTGPAGFVALLSATVAACFATYVIGRDVAWLRPLIGLTPRAARPLVSAPA